MVTCRRLQINLIRPSKYCSRVTINSDAYLLHRKVMSFVEYWKINICEDFFQCLFLYQSFVGACIVKLFLIKCNILVSRYCDRYIRNYFFSFYALNVFCPVSLFLTCIDCRHNNYADTFMTNRRQANSNRRAYSVVTIVSHEPYCVRVTAIDQTISERS